MRTLEERVAMLELRNKSLEKVLLSQYHFFLTLRAEAEYLRNEVEIYLEGRPSSDLSEVLKKVGSVSDNLQECARPVYHCIERHVLEQNKAKK